MEISMKRFISTALVVCFFLSGCTVRVADSDNGDTSQIRKDRYAVTEADSEVTLDIYPDNCRDTLIGKFDRYQYRHLSDEQKRIYILMDNAIYLMKTGNIALGKCNNDDVTVAYYALRNDRPEYFWIPSKYYYISDGGKMSVCFAEDDSDWLCTADQRRAYEDEICRFIERFAAETQVLDSEYDIELSAHETVAAAVKYDFDAAKNINKHIRATTVVGAFADGMAVCTGYAKAMQMLCLAKGIDCMTVTGSTAEPHMWNCVNIGGKWYFVDVTADDSSDNGYHTFLNVTTEYIKLGCRLDPDYSDLTDEEEKEKSFNLNVPECTSLDANYFHVNSLYITNVSQFKPTVISEVCAAARSGRKKIEICFDPSVGFVSGQPFDGVLDIEDCLITANAELSPEQKIRGYSVVSIERSTCITIILN